MGDLDAGGVVDQALDVGKDAVVERGGKEQRLAVGRQLRHDLAHLGHEAHVEHAVGLVQHKDLHAAEAAGVPLDQVDQAAGRRDEHVAAAAQGVDLGLVADAADHGRAAVVTARGDGARDVLDLARELARGGHDQHERTLTAAGVAELAHGRQEEGRRLARSGLGGGEQVAACEDLGDRGGLHGGGLAIAEVFHGGEHGVGKPEVRKGDGRGAALYHAGNQLSDMAVRRAVCPGEA